jgi:class 3 adenylate cyclase/YHS domain-containing protein
MVRLLRYDGCVGAPSLTFAFVDMSGYTALTEAHGDDSAADCATRFYDLSRLSLQGDARIVKRIGDAVMLVSSSARDAVATVMSLVAAADAEPEFPALRAGLDAGPAVERDGDYFGATVNLAARIGAHARAGEVLCGESVAQALAGDPSFRVVPLGSVALKNVGRAVPIHSVLAVEASPAAGVVDPVCRMKLPRPRVIVEHEGRVLHFCSDACADRFRASPETFLEPRAERPGR